MHLVSYIDTQIARVTPLSVARIFGGLLPRLCSFMLISTAAANATMESCEPDRENFPHTWATSPILARTPSPWLAQHPTVIRQSQLLLGEVLQLAQGLLNCL